MKTTIIFLLLIYTLHAQPLKLERAVEMALQSNPQTQAAQLRVQSSQADTKAAKSALHPRIDLNGEYYPTKTIVMPTNGTFSTRQTDAFHTDISASYSLWDFGRNDNIIEATRYAQEGSVTDKVSVQNSLIEQVWLQYTNIAYLEQLIDTARKSSEFYKAQYVQAVQMREVGLKTQADESRFKASWLEADDHHSAAQAQKAKVLMALELLISSDVPVTIDQADFDRRSNALTMVVENAPALRQELSQNNPQLQKLRMSINRDKALSHAISKQSYGSVNLVAAYGYDNSLSSYDTSQIGIRGSIPLYDGEKLDTETQKSRIALSLAQKEYENTERALWQELYDAMIDLNRFDETITAKEGVMSATQKALSLMRGRYAQGLATYIDVLESQNVLENARIAHADAKLQKIRSWVKIQRLLNKGMNNGML
ncbi:MAG: TolC family protein [Sulfuricurvum sp.]|nr:TolC family protein [Sulfuricurvum sp.]